jgi:hypothetical protein
MRTQVLHHTDQLLRDSVIDFSRIAQMDGVADLRLDGSAGKIQLHSRLRLTRKTGRGGSLDFLGLAQEFIA